MGIQGDVSFLNAVHISVAHLVFGMRSCDCLFVCLLKGTISFFQEMRCMSLQISYCCHQPSERSSLCAVWFWHCMYGPCQICCDKDPPERNLPLGTQVHISHKWFPNSMTFERTCFLFSGCCTRHSEIFSFPQSLWAFVSRSKGVTLTRVHTTFF